MQASAPQTPSMQALPSGRRELLTAIKKQGEARADDLAAGLGVTVSAVRQHLQGLAAEGLVTHREERNGPGRPRHLYRLTSDAEALFPKNYANLANELLGYVEEEDPAILPRAFERRAKARTARVRSRLDGMTLDEKVPLLAAILTEDGYIADCRHSDGIWTLTERNCAILAVAFRYGHACKTEFEFLRRILPEAHIERVTHIVSGDAACAYRITPKDPS